LFITTEGKMRNRDKFRQELENAHKLNKAEKKLLILAGLLFVADVLAIKYFNEIGELLGWF
jgi:hypothetical protein